MTDPTGVTIEVTIAAPIEAVWQSLRDPLWIRRWHGWHAEELDEEIDLIYVQNATEGPEPYVLDLGDDRFVLTECDGGTHVRLIRSPPGNNPEWDAYYDDITEGWTSFLQQLRFALERHSDRDRRTLFFNADQAGDPLAALAVDERTPGMRYAVARSDSPLDGGEVWFVSEHQLGLTLDDLGPGLLVVGAKPVTAHNAAGGAMAILTTYGLDDDAFAAVRDRWSGWWRTHYPEGDEPVE